MSDYWQYDSQPGWNYIDPESLKFTQNHREHSEIPEDASSPSSSSHESSTLISSASQVHDDAQQQEEEEAHPPPAPFYPQFNQPFLVPETQPTPPPPDAAQCDSPINDSPILVSSASAQQRKKEEEAHPPPAQFYPQFNRPVLVPETQPTPPPPDAAECDSPINDSPILVRPQPMEPSLRHESCQETLLLSSCPVEPSLRHESRQETLLLSSCPVINAQSDSPTQYCNQFQQPPSHHRAVTDSPTMHYRESCGSRSPISFIEIPAGMAKKRKQRSHDEEDREGAPNHETEMEEIKKYLMSKGFTVSVHPLQDGQGGGSASDHQAVIMQAFKIFRPTP